MLENYVASSYERSLLVEVQYVGIGLEIDGFSQHCQVTDCRASSEADLGCFQGIRLLQVQKQRAAHTRASVVFSGSFRVIVLFCWFCLFCFGCLETASSASGFAAGGVGGDGGDVFDASDFESVAGEGSEGRLGAGSWGPGFVAARAADLDVEGRDAEFLAADGHVLGGEHGGVGGGLVAVGLDLHAARDPDERLAARQVRHVHKRVVEARKQMRHAKHLLALHNLGTQIRCCLVTVECVDIKRERERGDRDKHTQSKTETSKEVRRMSFRFSQRGSSMPRDTVTDRLSKRTPPSNTNPNNGGRHGLAVVVVSNGIPPGVQLCFQSSMCR